MPSSVTRPFSKSTTRSAWCSQSGDAVLTTVVRPCRTAATRTAIRASVWASTAEVGSTSTRIGGVGGERPGEHDPLALAAGQPAATLVEHALPAARERVVHVLGVGHADGLLGLGASQPAVRVDGVLQGAGEELAAGVADQDLPAYVVQRRSAQVDAAEPDAPLTVGQLLVEGGQAGALGKPLRPGATGCATLDALLELLADRLGVGGQVAAQTVGEGGGLLRHRAHHDRQLSLACHEAGELVVEVGIMRERVLSARSGQGGCSSKIATAFRAETMARVVFWASSKKVWIG